MGKRKKEDDISGEIKQKKNQSSVIMMIFVVGKEIVFPVNLKLEGDIFE